MNVHLGHPEGKICSVRKRHLISSFCLVTFISTLHFIINILFKYKCSSLKKMSFKLKFPEDV